MHLVFFCSQVIAAEDLNFFKLYRADGSEVGTTVLGEKYKNKVSRSDAVDRCNHRMLEEGSGIKAKCVWGTEIIYLRLPVVDIQVQNQGVEGSVLNDKNQVAGKFEMYANGKLVMLNQIQKKYAINYCSVALENKVSDVKCTYGGEDLLNEISGTSPLTMSLKSDVTSVEYGGSVRVSWEIKNTTQCTVENDQVEPKHIGDPVNYRDTHFELYGALNSQRYSGIKAPITVTLKCVNTKGAFESKIITIPLKKSTDPVTPVTSNIMCVDISKDLSLGQQDLSVYQLGIFFAYKKYLAKSPETMVFNQDILKGVKEFQTANNISENGVMGPKTRDRLRELSCIKKVSDQELSNVVKTVNDSTFAQTIGKYTKKYSEINKQECNDYSCILHSKVAYSASSTDTIKIEVQQIVKYVTKQESGAGSEFEMRLKSDKLSNGIFSNCIIGGDFDVVCTTTDRKSDIMFTQPQKFSQKKEVAINNEVVISVLSKIFPTMVGIKIVDLSQNSTSTSVSTLDILKCVNLTKALSKGSENNEVLKLQQFLFDGGYLTAKPNGYFGQGTVSAVKKFQGSNGIIQTGSVGQGTMRKVNELSCKNTTTKKIKTDSLSISNATTSLEKQIANNHERETGINTIVNAITIYSADNGKVLPVNIPSVKGEICATTGVSCLGMVDLGFLTLGGKYLYSMPKDPLATTVNGTGYVVGKSVDGRAVVAAPLAELGKIITTAR